MMWPFKKRMPRVILTTYDGEFYLKRPYIHNGKLYLRDNFPYKLLMLLDDGTVKGYSLTVKWKWYDKAPPGMEQISELME